MNFIKNAQLKNIFYNLLYHYKNLLKNDFYKDKIENTEDIIKEINIKSLNMNEDKNIPINWYTTFLLEYLKKIPKHLAKNDYEQLYNEMQNEINKSIISLKELSIDDLSVISGKIIVAQYNQKILEENKKSLFDIKLNKEAKKIFENYLIPIDLIFFLDNKNNKWIFQINKSNFKLKEKDKINKQRIIAYEEKHKIKLCITIEEFIIKFPDILSFEKCQDIDIIEFQRNLNLPNEINKYITIIKEFIEKEYKEEELNLILPKIYDYIMEKIYKKIYPDDNNRDNRIYQNSIKLSWVELKHFVKKEILVSTAFLNDISKYLNLIDMEKSPKKKFFNVNKIFNSVNILLTKFNGSKEIYVGIDDILPILSYAIIKAQPLRLYSNIKFLELYIKEKEINYNQLIHLLHICDIISNIESSNLFNISNEEFNEKCKKSLKNLN